MNFLISDEHYFHEGMITNCGRNFANVKQMNQWMISQNNEVVGKDDTVYHIGDFMYSNATYEQLCYIMSQLQGRHHLILGNHDHFKPFQYTEAGFISVHTAFWWENLVMVHDPSVYTFCKKELGILVHGHVHDLYHTIEDRPVVNVSVEMISYRPVTFEYVNELVFG